MQGSTVNRGDPEPGGRPTLCGLMADSISWFTITLLLAAALLAFAFFSRALLRNPRLDFEGGFMWHSVRLYSKLMHSVEVRGRQHMPQFREPGPLILVLNHTAGVDPVLVQAVCPFEIRWVMASDMRHPLGEPIWRWSRVIFVDRSGQDVAGAREAIRHVTQGGVLGIFPEGAIERPPGVLLPFQPGVGFIIRRTGAPVLPVVIENTPQGRHAWSSLWTVSRSRVTFLPPVEYTDRKWSPEEIAGDLRARFAAATGWALSDEDGSSIVATSA
jgi:1-acyl-sn-glycerol-3-phosphate acyltransferase